LNIISFFIPNTKTTFLFIWLPNGSTLLKMSLAINILITYSFNPPEFGYVG
jgi:hypothetical protein